jgi:uncharacterized protein
MNQPRLVLFTRFPVIGGAKTRLIPAIGAAGAAAVHKRLTERTIDTLRRAGQRIEVRYTGAGDADFTEWLGEGIDFIQQVEGDLTARLLDALDPGPVIFFGADTPDLTVAHINSAIDAFSRHEVVIGPASDGGYYLIGVAKPYRFLFEDMPWSTEHVLPQTLSRLQQRDITPLLLETLDDCDRPDDLPKWPWLTA